MAYKNGFIIGLVVGLLAYLWASGIITVSALAVQPSGQIDIIASILGLLSVVLAVISAFRGHSTLGTTGDGFVYGFTIGFDALTIISYVYAGQLPPP